MVGTPEEKPSDLNASNGRGTFGVFAGLVVLLGSLLSGVNGLMAGVAAIGLAGAFSYFGDGDKGIVGQMLSSAYNWVTGKKEPKKETPAVVASVSAGAPAAASSVSEPAKTPEDKAVPMPALASLPRREGTDREPLIPYGATVAGEAKTQVLYLDNNKDAVVRATKSDDGKTATVTEMAVKNPFGEFDRDQYGQIIFEKLELASQVALEIKAKKFEVQVGTSEKPKIKTEIEETIILTPEAVAKISNNRAEVYAKAETRRLPPEPSADPTVLGTGAGPSHPGPTNADSTDMSTWTPGTGFPKGPKPAAHSAIPPK